MDIADSPDQIAVSTLSGKMTDPFFSIVLPTYNRAHLIRRPIESVLAQTYKSWELIVVDDGSTDNTRQLVEHYGDHRIKYIYQENKERSAARNTGVKSSTGDYVCFLDSDDYYLPDRLEMIFSHLESMRFPKSLFYTNKMIERDGYPSKAIEELILHSNIYDQIITSVIHAQQVCAHHTIFQKHLFDSQFRISEDTELWLRVADDFKIVPVNQFTVVIVEHPDRTVNKNVSKEMLKTAHFFLDKKHSGKKISSARQKELISGIFQNIAKGYLVNGQYLKGLGYLFRSVLADIHNPQTKYKLNIALKVILPNYSREAVLKLLESETSTSIKA